LFGVWASLSGVESVVAAVALLPVYGRRVTAAEIEKWYLGRCAALEADIVFLARMAGNTMPKGELLQAVRNARIASEADQ